MRMLFHSICHGLMHERRGTTETVVTGTHWNELCPEDPWTQL